MDEQGSHGGRVVAVNVSRGGVPKLPVARAWLRANGVEGDKQNNTRFHGGPERAVCLWSQELIVALQAEGHAVAAGTTGENLTLEGVNWDEMRPGARLRVGAARLEIASYTKPCFKIAESFENGEFKRVYQKLRPGWSRVYARVLQEGEVQAGDCVEFETA